jgi:hypothetical protein
MITTEDTARRTPGLANVRIVGHTRLRESGLQARGPVVGPVLKQHHRTARLAWTRARRRWMLHTWPHIHFSDELRFSLRFSDGRYRVYAGLGYVLRTSVCTSPTFLEADVLWSGLKFIMMVARNIECRKLQRRHS